MKLTIQTRSESTWPGCSYLVRAHLSDATFRFLRIIACDGRMKMHPFFMPGSRCEPPHLDNGIFKFNHRTQFFIYADDSTRQGRLSHRPLPDSCELPDKIPEDVRPCRRLPLRLESLCRQAARRICTVRSLLFRFRRPVKTVHPVAPPLRQVAAGIFVQHRAFLAQTD